MPSNGSRVSIAGTYSASGRVETRARATASSTTGTCTKLRPQPATYTGPARSVSDSPRSATIAATSSSATGPTRSRGVADSSTRSTSKRTPISPAPQCCTTESVEPASSPSRRSTHAVPRVGCPANGISPPGVKIRVA